MQRNEAKSEIPDQEQITQIAKGKREERGVPVGKHEEA